MLTNIFLLNVIEIYEILTQPNGQNLKYWVFAGKVTGGADTFTDTQKSLN